MQQNDKSSKNEKYIQQSLFYLEHHGQDDVKARRRAKSFHYSLDMPAEDIESILKRLGWPEKEVSFKRFSTYISNNQKEFDIIVQKTFGPPHNEDKNKGTQKHKIDCDRFLKRWELFSLVLPAKTRHEAYEPAYNDLLASFLKTSNLASSGSAVRWLQFCFVCQTLYMVADCFRVWIGAKLRALIWDSLWESFRRISGG